MINRKLCIVVCCLGVGFAHAAQAQSSGGDDQSKALDALRQAEKGPAKTRNVVAATPAPAPASSDADNAQALDALRTAEKGGPIAAPANAAPAAAPVAAAAPANPDDQARALEALHSAELSQQQNSAATQLQQAQAEKKAAERARMSAASHPMQAQYSAPPAKQDDADTVSAKAALEQFEMSGGAVPENPERRSEVAALRRQHAQEEAAFHVETLQKQLKSQPTASAPAVSGPPPGSKEGKLAELLRRYNADEITPLEYHTERAKIVAEP